MTLIDPILGAGMLSALKQFVMTTKLHPILVNFTVALVPVSLASDCVGRFIKSESFRHTAWWTLFYATAVTPFTAITGWLFWMSDDNGVTGMTIHKWLGTALGRAFVRFVCLAVEIAPASPMGHDVLSVCGRHFCRCLGVSRPSRRRAG